MEDELYMVRLAWSEFSGKRVNIDDPDAAVRSVRGIAVVDARGMYDALVCRIQLNQLDDRRVALELLAYYYNMLAAETETRWVHSEANLSDCMTKLGARQPWHVFMQTGTWSIVFDEACRSSKRRRAQGLQRFESHFVDDFKPCLARVLKDRWPAFCENGVITECEWIGGI